MFKRMSILLRRQEDTRDSFATKWEYHGTLVSQLPLIRTYLQNHVVEIFTPQRGPEADGIVELRFDKPEDMAMAFSDAKAVTVKTDEPNFLGHGTGYALANDSLPIGSSQGAKLVIVLAAPGDGKLTADLLCAAASHQGFRAATRDDVKTIIARPEMERGPQSVSPFLHLLFDDPETASAAGRSLAAIIKNTALASVFRVRTITVI